MSEASDRRGAELREKLDVAIKRRDEAAARRRAAVRVCYGYSVDRFSTECRAAAVVLYRTEEAAEKAETECIDALEAWDRWQEQVRLSKAIQDIERLVDAELETGLRP